MFLATITAASIYTTVSITASIEASITATSVYTANLHRSLRVFAATITAASIYTAAMEAGAQMEAAVRRRGSWLRWRRVRRSTQQILPFPRPFLRPLVVCTA